MDETTPIPLPPPLKQAAELLCGAAEQAAVQSAQSLALGVVSMAAGLQRDRLVEAQACLEQQTSRLVRHFAEVLEDELIRRWDPSGRRPRRDPSRWDALQLVEDEEVERQLSADRLAASIAGSCEWELRELDHHLNGLRKQEGLAGTPARQPLAPAVIALALVRAVHELPASAPVRQLILAELGRTWSSRLAKTYEKIIARLRAAGVGPARPPTRQPMSPGLRAVVSPVPHPSTPASTPTMGNATPSRPGHAMAPSQAGMAAQSPEPQQALANWPRRRPDPALTERLRQLMLADPPAHQPKPDQAASGQRAPGAADAPATSPVNLIQQHRLQLLAAAPGEADAALIDWVGALFEHILADPKLPAVVGQLMGRLQIPVLRIALGDPGFLVSRRHPVRRLVNRMASLGIGLDELEPQAAQDLVQRLRETVQKIVDGAFDAQALYARQLEALELFVADQGRTALERQGPSARLLAEREMDQHLQRHVARQLRVGLQPLPVPDFLLEFICETWSEVMVRTARLQGLHSQEVHDVRETARDLFMSVRPKGTPEQRKAFLARLPRLMLELHKGMDLIGWPEPQRREFFGQLLPAHAQSLKGDGLRTLDFNLMSRQVESALDGALPYELELDLSRLASAAPADSAIAPPLSPDEARTVGLVAEDALDWQAQPAADIAEEPPLREGDLNVPGLPQAEPPEPTRGRPLADHLQLGVTYRMQLSEGWHSVRLTHISPGRNFFVFSRGRRHPQPISMTRRVLVRLCEAGRLRTYEAAYLLERATARTRRQLQALKPGTARQDAPVAAG